MKFLDFYQKFYTFPVFSYQEITKVYPDFLHGQILSWQKSGKIKRVVRGWYTMFDFKEKFKLNENLLFHIANKIYSPSYISLEMAFSYYNIIPEGVYLITSVTSKNTAKFSSEFGEFSFHQLKKDLMFGYDIYENNGFSIKIATLEKTLLDYFYLHPKISEDLDFEGLRLNTQELKAKLNISKLMLYKKVFNKKSLDLRVEKFLNYLKTS